MKILMIHNKYGKHSGEEAVVEAQIQLLEENGHEVITYFRSSEELETMPFAKAKAFFLGVRNNKSIRDIKEIIKTKKPNIVHIHNLYPLISPAILPVIKSFGVPIAMTIHNYRLLCPNGLFFTKGEICEKCTGASKELNCIINNCEGSIFKSTGYALRSFWARFSGQYQDYVDSFLCLNEFQKNKLIENGFNKDKCSVIPNFYTKEIVDKDYDYKNKKYVASAGRISPEKGLPVLLAAAKKLPNIPFHIAGLMRPGYEEELDIPENVTLRGMLNSEEMKTFYAESKFLAHTSACYEGFAMVFPEAMAQKVPIMAPDFGSYPEIIENSINGLLFKPLNSQDLADKISLLWNDEDKMKELGKNGFEIVKEKYSNKAYYILLLEAYKKLIVTPEL
ncbi:glycosyltransferase family 4 protein [Polaribacter ponticola]|uniref:Glycosyltransferase family 4 protein n=1 Tax=Polaribacter ponticola TaxID=2978475 RepID=A0ABT5SA19_9FLAO|nr:glycosyltransferase family 4 protein [Polaribacter sp. MSW5]MDD7914968.1 glycosyltransferase family 4 protein [Polaribacter sp. MSW5]